MVALELTFHLSREKTCGTVSEKGNGGEEDEGEMQTEIIEHVCACASPLSQALGQFVDAISKVACMIPILALADPRA